MDNLQLAAFIRNTLISVGSGVAVKYGLDASLVPSVVGAGMTIAGFAWSAWGHTRNNTIAATRSIPGVEAVVAIPSIANSDKFRRDDKVITAAEAKVKL
jgi:hypothetical protein